MSEKDEDSDSSSVASVLDPYDEIETDLEEYGLEDEDLEIFKNAQPPQEIKLPKTACCVIVDKFTDGMSKIKTDPLIYHKKSIKCLKLALEENSIECQINSIRNATVVSLYIKINNLLDVKESVHFADEFLRTRHEILFAKMCKILGIESKKSDKKFSEVLPIESLRTPDWIRVDQKNVDIIEITVTTNLDKAAKSKGIESMGYQSKYKREIDELISLGFLVSYHVVVFDSIDIADVGYKTSIKELCKIFNSTYSIFEASALESLRREFCKLSRIFYHNFADCLSKLFNKKLDIKNDRSLEVKKILNIPALHFGGEYKLINISPMLFETITRNWSRMSRVLYQFYDEINSEERSSPIYDHATSKFSFIDNNQGLDYNDWIHCIMNDNKALFCRYLKLYYKNDEIKDRKAGFEFFYFEENDPSLKIKNRKDFDFKESCDPLVYNHQNIFILDSVDDIICDDEKFVEVDYYKLSSEYEDPEYNKKIQNCYLSLYEKWKLNGGVNVWCTNNKLDLLASKDLNPEMVSLGIKNYEKKLLDHNCPTLGEEIKMPYCKSATIFPINMTYPNSYGNIRTKPTIVDEVLLKEDFGEFTNKIIQICSKESFEWGSRPREENREITEIKKKIKDLQGDATSLQKIALKTDKSLKKLKDIEGGIEISSKLSEYYKSFRKLKEKFGGEKSLSTIRLRTAGASMMKNMFKDEMNHFKKKDQRSVYKGVGMSLNFEEIKKSFSSLNGFLLGPAPTKSTDEIYDENIGQDINLFQNLKKDYLNSYQSYYNWLKSTNLYHCCAFISRLCHTLLFYSQTSLGSSYIVVDNLGYNDCILICKGGKKIFPTKRSKLFRIFYPTSTPYLELMFPSGFDTSYKKTSFEGRHYIMSPWLLWHETHLTDGLSYLSKLMGFCLLSSIPERDHFTNTNHCLFNIFLAFHARRQTESMLHNLRYIMVNCLGDWTAIDDMLPEFVGFNYDTFQYYIRSCIALNFKNYFNHSQKLVKAVIKEGWNNAIKNNALPHLFHNISLSNSDDFARSIYSTYLMPKAPITQSLEQVANLKSMLETHSLFKNQSSDDLEIRKGLNYITLNNTENEETYVRKLFDSDFNFDPSYMINLGKMMSDYLKNKFNKSEMSITWDKILSKSWDTMSNSSGLRGEKDDFFGKKGFYIVYDDLLNKGKLEKLLTELSKTTIDEKKINKMNESYLTKIKDESMDSIVFHVVDKVQRGGKREIFVMDKLTKVHQQPIEQMMAEISKKCPSEMISIPSNKRLHNIHSRVFESKHDQNNQAYYWVMDCRKWAPRSMLEKFIYFLSGMREILPPSFMKHCYNFFIMMLDKTVHTRPHIVDIIKNSKSNNWINYNWLVQDKERKSMCYNMSYSWMMGIFNYFSSLIHVANQLHASHIIQSVNMIGGQDFVTLTPIAHSDDSAAKFSSPNKSCTQKSLAIYEMLLKSSNHMLSKKKCNVGRVYFEFISVLYLGNQLLPLLPKFLGQFNFQPTDGGYCTDINDAYSKCINLIQNGATFQQAYLSIKIQSMLIWRFYFGLGRAMNYNLPTQLYGSIDSHPIMVLLAGSDSDIIRLLKVKGEKYLNKLSFINSYINPNKDLGVSLFHPITASPDIRPNSKIRNHIEKIPESYQNDVDWSLTNVNFENTAINLLQYLLKLKSKTFCAAMQDDTITRRISRSFYFRESAVIRTNVGMMKQGDLITLITVASEADNLNLMKAIGIEDAEGISSEILSKMSENQKFSKIVGLIYSEVMRLLDYWSKMSYTNNDMYNQSKTTKPIHISLQKTIGGLNIKFDPSNLTSWIKEPKYRNILSNSHSYLQASSEFDSILSDFNLKVDEVDSSTVFHILNKMKSKSVSNIYCYGNVPSGLREINTYQDITLYLAHNSFESKYIKGLTLPLGRTINIAAQSVMPELRLEDVQITCAILNIIISCYCTLSEDSFSDFLGVDVIPPMFLESSEHLTLKDLPKELCSYWNKDRRTSEYFLSLLKISKAICNSESINTSVLEDSYYYCFLKRQFLVMDTWMGKGKIFIAAGNCKMVIEIDGRRVINLIVQSTTIEINKPQLNYLNFVLHSCEVTNIFDHMLEPISDSLDRLMFGISFDGSYKVSTGRNLIKCIPSLTIDPNLNTRLTNLGSFKMVLKRRMKVELIYEDEIFGDKNFLLNLFIVDPEKSLEIGKRLIKNTLKNEGILAKWNRDKESYIIDILSQSLDIDLFVRHDEVYNHYDYSKIYKIMNHMQSEDLVSIHNNKLRKNMYPAQEGGLLDLLIKYQIKTGSIDFNWNRIVTPELMHLKSSQPEAFMASLVDNISVKYNSLYDLNDKEQMFRELSEIMEAINNPNIDKKLIDMLTMWGFVGVSGSLNEMSSLKVRNNFQIFRDYDKDFSLINEFSKCFLNLARVIFNCFIDNFDEIGNDFIPITETSLFHYSRDGVKNLLISIVMIWTCNLYDCGKSKHLYIDSADMLIYEILINIVKSPDLRQKLLDGFSKDYLLCQIPIDENCIDEIFRVYRSTQRCFELTNKIDEKLENDKKINRINIKLPNVKAKEICEELNINFNLRTIFYNGLIPVKVYDRFNRAYLKIKGDRHMRIMLKVVDDSDVERVNFHPNYNFDKRLDQDFVESEDFEEINYELGMMEPDLENIEDTLKNTEKIYKEEKIMKILINNNLVEHYKIPVLNYIGKNNTHDYLNSYLQSGNDVVILTNSIYIPMFFSNIKFNMFRPKNRDWHDKSLLNSDQTFIIVISKNIKDILTWCEILDADIIDKDMFPKLAFKYKLTSGRTADNAILDDYQTVYGDPNENNNVMERKIRWKEDENVDEESDEDNNSDDVSDDGEGEKDAKIEDFTFEMYEGMLKDKGIESDSARRFAEIACKTKKEGKRNIQKIFQKIFEDLVKNKKLFSKILNMKDNIINSPLTEDRVMKIFQVPGVFGSRLGRESNIRNNALKDKELLAEIDSLSGDQATKLISGLLTITPKMFQRVKTCLSMCRKLTSITQKDKRKKTFLLDFLTLLTNDAKETTDSPSDENWSDIIAIVYTYIDWDDEEEAGSINIYQRNIGETNTGRIGYRLYSDKK